MLRTAGAQRAGRFRARVTLFALVGVAALLPGAGCRTPGGSGADRTSAQSLLVSATEADFDQVALKSQVPVLVDFYADWCPPCRKLHPNLEELAHAYPDQLRVVQVNVDRSPQLARRYGIQAIPALFVIKGGREVARAEGYQSIEQLKALVGPHL